MKNHPEFHNINDDSDGIIRQLANGLSTRIYPGDQAMISIVSAEPHAKGESHHHPEEQWGICIEGGGIRFQGDEEITFKEGDFWRTPGGMPHTIHAGAEGCRIIDVFAPPRDEYRKAGSGFN